MLRLVLSPRWMMWHVLTIGAMITCGLLSAWQWRRAGSALGSALNIGYGLQWPLFALFFGVMWWRMLTMEIRRLSETDDGREDELVLSAPAPVAVRDDGPSPFGPRPAAVSLPTVDDDPELAAYNRMLAQLAARDSS